MPIMQTTTKEKFGLKYKGSIFWLVVWMIVFFPIGLALVALNSEFDFGGKRYEAKYEGSQFWLLLWLICFFPIAILLIMFNGFSIERESITAAP